MTTLAAVSLYLAIVAGVGTGRARVHSPAWWIAIVLCVGFCRIFVELLLRIPR